MSTPTAFAELRERQRCESEALLFPVCPHLGDPVKFANAMAKMMDEYEWSGLRRNECTASDAKTTLPIARVLTTLPIARVLILRNG